LLLFNTLDTVETAKHDFLEISLSVIIFLAFG
jgi:hypothetical protein